MGSSTKTERNIAAVDVGFVRAELARQRITKSEAAAELHITPAEMSRKANGHAPFSVCEVDRLADVLGCTTDEIFGRA